MDRLQQACECEKDGNIPIKVKDIFKKIEKNRKNNKIKFLMKVIIIGLGIQGEKRRKILDKKYLVATVDPINKSRF